MNLLRGVNLYLIGMMGAGKTTVGRWLAQELEYRFFDTDDIITQIANRSIPEIFAQDGEEAFRQLETEVLAQLSPYKNLTVATGGGIVLRQMNWSYLHHGLTVWLDVPVAELYTRLQGDTTRPLLQDPDPPAKLETLLSQREKLYAQADVRVRVNRGETPEVIGRRVLEEIQKVIKPEGSDPRGVQTQEESPN